jgi:hypothetical protein
MLYEKNIFKILVWFPITFKSTGNTTVFFRLRVSEWLLFNANTVIFQLYHRQNMLIFNDWLIDWCLAFSEQFFSYIQDENI